jgi:vesicle transport through interaction with t-SNAREs protein 1
MGELHDQRQTLIRAKERVSEVRDTTRSAGGVLKSMSRRETCNKLMLYGVIVFLVIVIGVVAYFAFFKK